MKNVLIITILLCCIGCGKESHRRSDALTTESSDGSSGGGSSKTGPYLTFSNGVDLGGGVWEFEATGDKFAFALNPSPAIWQASSTGKVNGSRVLTDLGSGKYSCMVRLETSGVLMRLIAAGDSSADMNDPSKWQYYCTQMDKESNWDTSDPKLGGLGYKLESDGAGGYEVVEVKTP